MTKIKKLLLFILIICFGISVGCGEQPKEITDKIDSDVNVQQKEPEENKGNVELTLWSWFSQDGIIKQFEAENKGITVKEKIFSFDECSEEYIKALSSGEGPDIFIFDSAFFGVYTVNNVLQDLYEEPFNAGKYKDDFLGFESGLSVDKKQLLSLSINTAPYVTMYRADIMKENGFPYEPDEFGKFIENPDNLIKIAKKLKESGKYIFSYPTDLPDVVGNYLGHFDDDFNYLRQGNLFEKSLDIMLQSRANGWFAEENFWGEGGKAALKEDRLVMCFYGSYIMGTLESYVPEQKGKWRITTPPFGLASWASDARAAINIQSNHKEEAWKLIEYIVTQKSKDGRDYINVVPSYKPYINAEKNLNRKLDFYGGQNVYPIIKELAEKTNYYKLTPMDEAALEIYRNSIWSEINGKLKPNEIVEKIKKRIDKELGKDKKALIGE